MKKYINGKVYNTETATECGSYEPNPYRSDFHWYCETLYQKKTGEFFIHGEGNAASKYSRSCGQNEWCGDEVIKPITVEAAHKWAEECLTAEEYDEIFGEIAEDDEKIVMSVYVSKETHRKIKAACAEQGISFGDYITKLVEK